MNNNYLDSQELLAKLADRIKNITQPKLLVETKNIFHKEFVKPFFDSLRNLKDVSAKKALGSELKILQEQIENLIQSKKIELEQMQEKIDKPNYDLMLPPSNLKAGSNHVLQLMIDQVINFFKQFNFKIINLPELTSTKFCFDDLNVPSDHPGRAETDTFYIDDYQLLRSQCTAATVQAAASLNKLRDIRVLSFGNVYRNDTTDATHSHQFMQVDFMWIKENMSLANHKWFIQSFLNYIFGSNLKNRFRLSYFPFTEPSLEVDVECWNCQNGCTLCKFTKWIEILGSGILHPNVIKAIGLPKKMRGIAAGIGIERLVMLKHGITDMREIYSNDFRFNEQFKD
ncbi:phenylalanine--tRNA ligase subunit alpha [[Mycoplasma] testudinis]|uniref:phenylalanine--tRNA ligase subunit alpha n=1 Tax=[Mycoplasma] testudinis TaxID=33924 RepID=UPI000566F127|nr:phenylalanine--tRNA ligase subunit alpha [[Mycoplasma] testudinis]